MEEKAIQELLLKGGIGVVIIGALTLFIARAVIPLIRASRDKQEKAPEGAHCKAPDMANEHREAARRHGDGIAEVKTQLARMETALARLESDATVWKAEARDSGRRLERAALEGEMHTERVAKEIRHDVRELIAPLILSVTEQVAKDGREVREAFDKLRAAVERMTERT